MSGFHEAAGFRSDRDHTRGLKTALASETRRAVNVFRWFLSSIRTVRNGNRAKQRMATEPGRATRLASSATVTPFAGQDIRGEPGAGAGRWRLSRADADALAAQGDPHSGHTRRGLVAKPVGESSDLGSSVETLQQFGHRLGWRRDAGTADQQALRLNRPTAS